LSDENAVVAIYETHSQAEEALKELQRAGFDMTKLSIVGKDYHTEEHVVGYYNTGDRMKRWGKSGAFWGGIWGLLLRSAFFAIPGIGPVLLAGPLVAGIVGALEGGPEAGKGVARSRGCKRSRLEPRRPSRCGPREASSPICPSGFRCEIRAGEFYATRL
jgi:hypothetical protein